MKQFKSWLETMTEAEKNYFVCAGLMLVCGIGMLLMAKVKFAIAFIAIGVIFAIVPIVMYAKGGRVNHATRELPESDRKNMEARAKKQAEEAAKKNKEDK